MKLNILQLTTAKLAQLGKHQIGKLKVLGSLFSDLRIQVDGKDRIVSYFPDWLLEDQLSLFKNFFISYN